MIVLRGQAPNDLAGHAEIFSLPFTDDVNVLNDPRMPLLFYGLNLPTIAIRVNKNEAMQSVDITF